MIEPEPTSLPDERGRFGVYGGRYAPQTLMPAQLEREEVQLAQRALVDDRVAGQAVGLGLVADEVLCRGDHAL